MYRQTAESKYDKLIAGCYRCLGSWLRGCAQLQPRRRTGEPHVNLLLIESALEHHFPCSERIGERWRHKAVNVKPKMFVPILLASALVPVPALSRLNRIARK